MTTIRVCNTLPHVVDVNWRLDYHIKVGVSASHDTYSVKWSGNEFHQLTLSYHLVGNKGEAQIKVQFPGEIYIFLSEFSNCPCWFRHFNVNLNDKNVITSLTLSYMLPPCIEARSRATTDITVLKAIFS